MPSVAGDSIEIIGSGTDAASSVAGSGLDPTTKIILIVVVVLVVLVGLAAAVTHHEKKSHESRDSEAGHSDGERLLEVQKNPYEPRRKGRAAMPSSPGQFAISELQLPTSTPLTAPPSPYFRDERPGDLSTDAHWRPQVPSSSKYA